jgi:hypothetical protein
MYQLEFGETVFVFPKSNAAQLIAKSKTDEIIISVPAILGEPVQWEICLGNENRSVRLRGPVSMSRIREVLGLIMDRPLFGQPFMVIGKTPGSGAIGIGSPEITVYYSNLEGSTVILETNDGEAPMTVQNLYRAVAN